MHRLIQPAVAAALFVLLGWLAANAAEFEEGVHYRRLDTPVPTSTGDQIEVAEIFWYGCPHCYDLEPVINRWLEQPPDNIAFTHIPAVLGRAWEPHARAYYTAQALGVLEKLHQPLFDALHKENRPLANERQLEDFFAEHGVDREAFRKVYNSFDVETKLRRAQQLVRRYGITGVPAVVVNGKYVVTGSMAGSNERIFEVVNYLVNKENSDA